FSSSIECPLIQKRITAACVEYCTVDGRSFESAAVAGFANLAKQLVNTGATLGSSVSASDLLTHLTTNYCDTCFNGVYLMLDSFLKVYHELPTILADEQKRTYLKIVRDEMELLCLYLKQFHDVIEKLSCEKTLTLHLVVPYK
ncbi:unnamed protein product, partial [Rotaria magnacalcarata]